jgi:hypothetical protein
MRRRAGRLMSLSILILPLIGVPLEADRPPEAQTRFVTSRIHIDASPDTVWNGLVDIRAIGDAEHRWNFSHDIVGIPRPKDARLEGTGVGAVRHLEWGRVLTTRYCRTPISRPGALFQMPILQGAKTRSMWPASSMLWVAISAATPVSRTRSCRA